MKRGFSFLFLCFLIGCSAPQPKTILAIFAHPDDENSIGAVLTKYTESGAVHLIVALDGHNGTANGYPAGDTLVKIREGETRCACLAMGLKEPVYLGYEDGFDTRHGVGLFMEKSRDLKTRLTNKIKEINPDVILTFGPDGDTGHPDHRLIGALTTEIVLREGWVDRYPVYYVAWDRKAADKFKELELNTVADPYLQTAIHYSEEQQQTALAALKCYKSQLSDRDIADWIVTEEKDKSNVMYFRRLEVSEQKKEGF